MSSDAKYLPSVLYRATDSKREANGDAEDGGFADSNKALAFPSIESTESIVSDESLLERVRDGSRDALGLLFRRHSRAVHNIAYRILRDAAEAEDLVQDVFLFIFRKAGLFDSARGNARSWLMQVAYHRAFDRRRHLTSRHFYAHLELDEESLLSAELQGGEALYAGHLEAAFGQETLRRIDAALSEAQKRVLRLLLFDGYTVEETAAILGQSPGNVRNHYYRALERMRREVFVSQTQGK